MEKNLAQKTLKAVFIFIAAIAAASFIYFINS